ncbi:MAG: hypothetical protein WD315_01160 [Balneolaceae bacterium]
MKRFATRQLLLRITTVLLLFGTGLPSGVQAGMLIEYCFSASGLEHTSMQENHSLQQVHESDGEHSCCPESEPEQNPARNCVDEDFCTCHFESEPVTDDHRTAFKTDLTPVAKAIQPVSLQSLNNNRPVSVQSAPAGSGPPIWLMNSTFLN